jgi:hypothetical protein
VSTARNDLRGNDQKVRETHIAGDSGDTGLIGHLGIETRLGEPTLYVRSAQMVPGCRAQTGTVVGVVRVGGCCRFGWEGARVSAKP